ncbi:hypothetical protein E6P09_00780 [Haloferax mediterranei ATCC 33500]|uniref:DUF7998 domain-containing protein n=1 Tax=Haloferax mediterranei (strain ATCC 33500 / DSM 1411 / JCM 8866 / NBRC 14739 / NCIMB 2177 / R-4) TaxID=523841 RepID=I3R6L1_HALMT|nr:hypothetical protein [Haloferax mediterranei]AFK19871.1 hypothetical protein HFX_2182 [Haloferax mediterranei ATCC 33500]AHZ23252.1 hypothetical protein BM92_11660 [Haloferax mediterranei ATCC 33500]ELZ99838.1 hypothetical protein C439_12719 [Haloferax mediterranei ATCC 33500]MDX5987380.1 hypothetical protein [Haloferax mediterranei ATCC 33500]QCQ73888.1 hypothetical protein E6P09_00780 [Haloferax mediterranei ATCC 33500]
MIGFPSPFGGGSDDELFDEYDEFVPEHIPEPDEFLDGHRVLTGDEHVAFHEITRDLFDERTVYDMTFNYNLARLNLDTRHEGAGYRYAEERDDPSVLRAEFTPTTPFCPQTTTLIVGSFRAWNGLSERHDYDLVRVRVSQMHHQSEVINEQLKELETTVGDSESVGSGSADEDRLSATDEDAMEGLNEGELDVDGFGESNLQSPF